MEVDSKRQNDLRLRSMIIAVSPASVGQLRNMVIIVNKIFISFTIYAQWEDLMPFSLLPKHIAPSLTALTPALFQQLGVRLLMLDFDNTIVPYTTSVPTDTMASWLREMQSSGIQVCVVSNSRKPRVRTFCQEYALDCITHAKKPFSRGIRACLEKYEIPASQAALVGDQIFTDTLGANRMGVTSILVSAIDNHNFWLKARHVLEMPFIFIARNRRITQ